MKLTGSTPALGSLNLDSNEIVQQGSSLYLGVVNPTQDIYFRQGANNLASIDGETGDLFVSGAVRKSDEFGQLHLYGGASASTGATINLMVQKVRLKQTAFYILDTTTHLEMLGQRTPHQDLTL